VPAFPKSILVVFEFPPSDAEWQVRDLAASLRQHAPHLEISHCSGFVDRYAPGGLHPRRLLNGIWVHVRAFFQIVFGGYDVVLVRSAPPLIQMTVAAACHLRRLPYWVWLMDAHPEIEHELWRHMFLVGPMCGLLSKLNASCLRSAALVVVLDDGMRQRLIPGLNESRVVTCPTWGSRVAPASAG
jgi:hypothetical protein